MEESFSKFYPTLLLLFKIGAYLEGLEEGVEDFLIMGVSSIKSTGDGVLDSSYTSSLSSSWYLSFSSATLDEIQPSLTSSSSLFVCSSFAPSISSSSSSLSLMSSLLYSSWSSSVSELSDSVA